MAPDHERQNSPSRAAVELAPLLMAAAVAWSAPPRVLLPPGESTSFFRVYVAWAAARVIVAVVAGWTLVRGRAVYGAAWRNGWRAWRRDRWRAPSTDCLTRLGLIVAVLATFNFVQPRLFDIPLRGYSAPAVCPKLSPGTLWSGEFTDRFEKRLAANLPGRGILVRTHNQINYSVFGEITWNNFPDVVQGANQQLFARGYLDEANGLPHVSPSVLREEARRLAELQSLLAARQIPFLFLITPNKATILPEFVPEKFRVRPPPTRPDAYRLFRPMLAEYHINYLDGRELFLQWKTADAPLFPSTDGHWDDPAAYRVFRRILDRLGPHRRFPPVGPACVEADAKRRPEVIDQASLANLLFPGRLYALPRPQVDLEAADADAREPGDLNVTLVGDSFLDVIRDFFYRCRLTMNLQYLYYYRRRAQKPPDDAELARLRQSLLTMDFVLVAANESRLAEIGYGFLADAVRVLSAPD